MDIVTDYFKKQQAHIGGMKHGEYGEREDLRDYPFSTPGAIDTFTLEPNRGVDRDILSKAMTEEILYGDLFQTTLAHTSKHKAPGPDGIPNELLRHSDTTFLDGLDEFMIGIWFTSAHPWPSSNTALLYKKGDPMEVGNYKPIGLTNTMYKLWTGMLTEVMSQQAESHQMMSSCQEGFRPYRNTARQLEMVVNVLEDARLHQHDLYMLFVDFTSAFNTTDHDKLLQIMHDMGFPAVAIDNVKGIYSTANTKILTPYGPTVPIPIDRGTIQGDTLSPFMFLVFMEPLLRWLHCGGRGYKFGCLSEEDKILHQCSSPAYADDLLCITHNTQDLKVQAHKITQFCEWAKMCVNAKKCGVTGIRYKSDGAAGSNPISSSAVAALERSLHTSVTVQGQHVPFLHPDGFWVIYECT